MAIITDAQLLERIEGFLDRHRIPHTRFGREAVGEPNFVNSMRGGRRVMLETANRALGYMAGVEASAEHAEGDTPPAPPASSGKAGELSSGAEAAA